MKVLPEQFQNGQPVEQLILICDVDGVIRHSVEATADLRVVHALKTRLATNPLVSP